MQMNANKKFMSGVEIVGGNYCETSRKEIHIHGFFAPFIASFVCTGKDFEMSYGNVSRGRREQNKMKKNKK